MKIKLACLILVASLLTWFIYNKYYHYTINITSINTLAIENNYNKYLANKISSQSLNVKLNVDFSLTNLEIENLNAMILNNYQNIQNVLYKSKVIIISIGNIDMYTETYAVMLKEYQDLFKLLRKYNNKEIIFISPLNFKKMANLKYLCDNYNILFINSNSYIKDNSNVNINANSSQILTDTIIHKISYFNQL